MRKLRGTVLRTTLYRDGEVEVEGPYKSKHFKGGIIHMDWEGRRSDGTTFFETRQIHTSLARVIQAEVTGR